MGKHNKHKKKLKQEKSKIKLRVKNEKTKFLPKGLNVTDTTFKIKPINLPQQLQAKTNQEPLSKRNLNTKELIQRLKHHNVNVKVESGEELCLIMNDTEILNKYLSLLLQSSLQLLLDKERRVRKICIKLTETILKNTPLEKIEPLFSVISSFLRCSMTNIDTNIQEDSLMLLDILLIHVPLLVAKDSEKLLTNFLTLISTLRADSKPGRTLTVNLGSKITTVKWKIKVLCRLKGMLQAIFDADTKNSNPEELSMQKVNLNGQFPIYKKIKYSNVFSTILENNNDVNVKQVRGLITLLYESWLEVAPDNKRQVENQEFTNLHSDAAGVLNCILNILYLLNKYMEQLEKRCGLQFKVGVMSKEYTKFILNLVQHFPYTQNAQLQNKNLENILEVQVDPKCLQENLLICYLFCLNSNNFNSDLISKITSYVNRCLKNRNYVPADKLQHLINLLNLLFNNKTFKDIYKEELMSNLINYYNNGYSAFAKNEVLCILSDLSTPLNRSAKYDAWLSTLPNILTEGTIHVTVINKLSVIAKQGSVSYHDALIQKMRPILNNALNAKIIGNLSEFENELTRIKILNMFTYSPKICSEHLEVIKDFISENKNTSYADYMIYNFVE